jgi:type IV secretory pathway VirB10-like protein
MTKHKMRNIKNILDIRTWAIPILIILLISLTMPTHAQKERKHIREGNDYFQRALGDSGYVDTLRMQKAELAYRKALDNNIDSYEGGFNLGASLYKQKKFTDATDQYKIIASKENDKKKLAKAYHNLGNSLLMDGKLEESIEAYKNGLRNNPSDTATKYNLAVAQKLLKEAEQQQCENPNQDQQEQDQQNQDQEQQEQQQQQEQQEQEQQKQEQQQAQESEEEKEGEEKQAMKEDEMSKEDAERLLQAIQQDEKELQEKLKQEKKKAKKVMIEKDW